MPHIYARVENGIVGEIVTIEDNTPSLSSRYHASLLDHFIELHGTDQYTVKTGWNYDGSGFSFAPNPSFVAQRQNVKISVFRQRMEDAGKWDDLVNILKDDVPTLLNLLTLDSGISPADKKIRLLIVQAGADPDEILKE